MMILWCILCSRFRPSSYFPGLEALVSQVFIRIKFPPFLLVHITGLKHLSIMKPCISVSKKIQLSNARSRSSLQASGAPRPIFATFISCNGKNTVEEWQVKATSFIRAAQISWPFQIMFGYSTIITRLPLGLDSSGSVEKQKNPIRSSRSPLSSKLGLSSSPATKLWVRKATRLYNEELYWL